MVEYPQAGHWLLEDVLQPCLAEGEHVGVALDDDRAGVDRLGAEGVEFVPTGIAHVWLDLFHVLDCSVERRLGGGGVDLLVTVDVDGQALFELVRQRCFDEGGEQRMRASRAALELRVCLGGNEERMLLTRVLDELDQLPVRREPDLSWIRAGREGAAGRWRQLAACERHHEPDLLLTADNIELHYVRVIGGLEELRTGHNPFAIEGMLRFFRAAYEKAYGTVDVKPEELARLHDVFARYPALILPAHKANVDAPVVNTVLADHGLPLPSLFAGINMSFWPMGPIMKRAGYIFLRRDIRENATYRFVLREYLAYLIERRFNLSWFPEGTRSRTGKLLPPKLGLLTYVVDAYRQGRIEDIMLVPVALVYDQVYETKDFAREAKGAKKKPENLGWMLRYLRSLRTPYGKAYLRVAEPLSMREALGAPDPATDYKTPEAQLALQKLSLAVSWRINQATPITGIALVTFALLATGGRSIPRDRLSRFVAMLVDHAERRGCPLADSARLHDPEQLDLVLETLMASGVITRFDGGPTPVFGIGDGQHIGAAFYRNSMLHFVLERAIAEVAAIGALAAAPNEREARFIETALALRESLKFEFFFRERPAFEQGLITEMDLIDPEWRTKLATAKSDRELIDSVFRVGLAHAALRPFLEAYRIVLDVLLTMPVDQAAQEKDVLAAADGLGRQYLLEKTIRNPEAVSRQLFGTAWQLACNVRLVEPGPDLAARREGRSRVLRATLAALDAIEDQCREALGG
mgnify:CR=1 FL=1